MGCLSHEECFADEREVLVSAVLSKMNVPDELPLMYGAVLPGDVRMVVKKRRNLKALVRSRDCFVEQQPSK